MRLVGYNLKIKAVSEKLIGNKKTGNKQFLFFVD